MTFDDVIDAKVQTIMDHVQHEDLGIEEADLDLLPSLHDIFMSEDIQNHHLSNLDAENELQEISRTLDGDIDPPNKKRRVTESSDEENYNDAECSSRQVVENSD